MAATDTGFDHMVDSTHRMATDMASTHKSAEGISGAFRQAALNFIGVEKIANLILKSAERTQTWQAFQKAINVENLTAVGLLTRQITLESQREFLSRRLRTATGERLALHQRQLDVVKVELAVLEKQKAFAAELNRIGEGRVRLWTIFKAAAIDMFIKEREMNQNLIEANSSYAKRGMLLHDTLMTQVQLGISFGHASAAARELVRYSLDTEDTFEANLRLVAQMEQGLGVSASESARLATIVERQLKGSFKDVADVVAQIVNDTALAGDEAVRLANSIGTAMGRLRPGMSAQGLPEVLRLVGRYEGALKEVGGAPGAFQQLIESLTKPEGIVGAGALGVNPEFIATSKGVQDVMDRFAQYGQALVGQSEGWGRQMRLAQLGEIFHLSADQANQLMLAINRAKDAQMGQITAQDRWREQLHATNSGIARLGNQLVGLMTGAMYPVSLAVAVITNKLADWLEILLSSKEAVYAVSLTLFGSFVALTASMWNLARSLVAVITTSKMGEAALARFAAAQAATAGAGAAGAAGNGIVYLLGYGIGRVIGLLLLNPIGLVATAIAGLSFYAAKQYFEIKSLREDSRKLEITSQERAKYLEQKRLDRIYTEARNFGSPEEILKQHSLNLQDIGNSAKSWADYNAQVAALTKETLENVDQAVTTKVMFKPLKDRTPEEAAKEEELLGLTGKLLDVNKQAQTTRLKQTTAALEAEQNSDTEVAKQRFFNQQQALPSRTSDRFHMQKFLP